MLNLIKWTVALEPLTIGSLLLVLCFSTVFGLIISIVYHFTHRKIGYDRSLLFTLMIMPLVAYVFNITRQRPIAMASLFLSCN
mgnify:CR=1 FL=1